MSLDQLLRHVAHLVTAHGSYSTAKDAMTMPVATAEAIFERRIKALPGVPALPFVFVLEEGRRRKFWKLEIDPIHPTLMLAVHWERMPRESFARQMEWFARMQGRVPERRDGETARRRDDGARYVAPFIAIQHALLA
jgi:hypothetical protein